MQRAVGTAIWHHANKCCELNKLDGAVRWWVLVEQPCLDSLPVEHRGACLRKAALSRLHVDDYEGAIDLVGRSSADPSRDASAQYILALVALLRGHEETGASHAALSHLTLQRCTPWASSSARPISARSSSTGWRRRRTSSVWTLLSPSCSSRSPRCPSARARCPRASI